MATLEIKSENVQPYLVDVSNELRPNPDKSILLTAAGPQSLQYNSVTSTSNNLTTANFTVETNSNLAFSPYVSIEYPPILCTLTIANTNGHTYDLTKITNAAQFFAAFSQFQNLALKPLGVMNLVSTINLQLNGQTVTTRSDPAVLFNQLVKYFDNADNLFPGLTTGRGDYQQDYGLYDRASLSEPNDANSFVVAPGVSTPCMPPVIKSADSPFIDSSGVSATPYSSRRPLINYVGNPTTNTIQFQFVGLSMGVPLSIFSSNIANASEALYGVNKLALTLSNVSTDGFNMLSLKSGGYTASDGTSPAVIDWADVTSMTLSTSDSCKLNYIVRSPPAVIQSSLPIKSYQRTFMDAVSLISSETILSDLPIRMFDTLPDGKAYPTGLAGSSGASSFQMPPIQLSSVPEKLMICVRKKYRDSTKKNSQTQALTSAASVRVKSLNIVFNNTTTVFDETSLNYLSSRNGCQIPQMVKQTMHGNGIIVLDLKTDLGLGSGNILLNSAISGPMLVTMSVESLTPYLSYVGAASETFVVEIFSLNTKLLQFNNGTFQVMDYYANLNGAPITEQNVTPIVKKQTTIVAGAAPLAMLTGVATGIYKNRHKIIGATKGAIKGWTESPGGSTGGSSRAATNVVGGRKKSTKIGGASLADGGFM